MEPLRVYQIDAFTTQRFQGNPAGVVANAAGLTPAQMQLIAREWRSRHRAPPLPHRAGSRSPLAHGFG